MFQKNSRKNTTVKSMKWKGIESLLRRISFVLLGMAIYRFGGFFPLPGIDMDSCAAAFKKLQSGHSIFTKIDNFFGGNFSRVSIFFVGIQPYITASIIMRFFVLAIPSLKTMQKEDSSGRERINRYMRLLSVVIAFLQAIVSVCLFNGSFGRFSDKFNFNLILSTQGYTSYFVMIPCLVAWSTFLMWVGEQITEYGIGNGTSVFILSSQLSRLLPSCTNFIKSIFNKTLPLLSSFSFLLFFVLLIMVVVFFERTYKRISIHFPEKQASYRHSIVPGSSTTSLPIKFNIADIMPVFVANTFMIVLDSFIKMMDSKLVNNWFFNRIVFYFQDNGIIYNICYSIILCIAVYIYASINFDCMEIADYLKNDNAFISGVRPGYRTSLYLENISNKIVRMSVIYLVTFICIIPYISNKLWGSEYNFFGVSILLTVSIIMDMLDNIVTHLYTYRYESVLKHSSFWKLNKIIKRQSLI